MIKATGEIQEQLGCGVSFHPHRDKAAPFEVMRLYLEAGGRANKAVMSHIDSEFYTRVSKINSTNILKIIMVSNMYRN